ncbi:39S ribosomal protein L23, mitochondrial isoform X1 [Rissa tridactyla]|uniref:39S ribosomal protein L23, mitochondrial isoform X1 n=1 Tax=Rissa tridactyla TaxID=75485 RepID=UPI0023BAAA72|nr:39S ribosomal protein L23, mitochondrial isoform X1 [Rissa tridactyla]
MATGARRAVYPLFQLGGPQLRIFRPNFFMLAVRPGVPQPEDTVQFRVSMEMTKVDIKNYLEKIYNVPVAAVRTRIQYGANNKRNHKNQRVKKPDYKVAYVQLFSGCNVLAVSNRVWLPAKSEFLQKTRAGKSQLVCADFDLLKDSRYRLTFSAQYLTFTSLEMGTVSTSINS